MRYLVVIEESETGFGAYVPDLPGCVAVAATRDDVSRLIHQAVEFHLDGLKQDGLPIPTAHSFPGKSGTGAELACHQTALALPPQPDRRQGQ